MNQTIVFIINGLMIDSFFCFYVDDILTLTPGLNLIDDSKKNLSYHFDMKNLDKANLILEM